MALKPPPASSEAVRNTMLANRSTDTGPEKAVRRMLREAGHPEYRLHWRIDGTRAFFMGNAMVCGIVSKIADTL